MENVTIKMQRPTSVLGGNETRRSLMNMPAEYSLSPHGEKFRLPSSEEYSKRSERLRKIINDQRALRHEIVVVMCMVFVGV